jgi:predicted metal-dependent hydrolase
MMALENKCDEFQKVLERGIAQFNDESFFETHETWEKIWLSAAEPQRTYLQGMIQIAAAFHHYKQGNRAGARSLLAAGLKKLEEAPDDLFRINLAKLRQTAKRWLAALGRNERPRPTQFPKIERASASIQQSHH